MSRRASTIPSDLVFPHCPGRPREPTSSFHGALVNIGLIDLKTNGAGISKERDNWGRQRDTS